MNTNSDQHIFPLHGAVQHYAWGGFQFIPDLLQIEKPVKKPYAELWMGTHPRGTARVESEGREYPLDKLIARNSGFYLGSRVAADFDNRLPFLFKILDVRKMLSIQAHPNKEQAERGYRKENELGIPIDAAHRVFKDDNHKPEVMVALSEFWLLHGFRPTGEIELVLADIPEFKVLQPHFQGGNIAKLYRHIMEMEQRHVNQLLAPMYARLQEKTFLKEQPEYWAKLAFEDYTTEAGDFDRGIFSIFLFNLVHLKPGSGIFQDAGIPHAYLEGVNVELMANSDNVFRGGLTPKHIDVPALMSHLIFDPVHPKVLRGKQLSSTERLYPTPAPDFQLSRLLVAPGREHKQAAQSSPQLCIVTEGSVEVDGLRFNRGASFFVTADTPYQIRSQEASVLFKAAVPEKDDSR